MPTLDQIVDSNAFILFGEATNLQKEILRNACRLYATSIVPEDVEGCNCPPELCNHNTFEACRNQMLEQIKKDSGV